MNQPVAMQTLLPDILGAKGIVGCPPEIALDALRKTAIDFCTQTGIFEFHDGFTAQYNVTDYPINVPEGTRVASMKWVTLNGNGLNNNPYAGYPRINNSGRDPNTFFYNGSGYGFTMEGRDVFWIRPAPLSNPCTDEIAFCAALKPTQNSCELPYILYEDWNDAMTAGTAFRLFSMPRQEWSNGGLAMLNRKEFNQWVARARLTRAQGYTERPLIMSGSYF